ncbi:TPA: glycosyltransferase family 2 protein [Vibrio vulnificus]|nr:glycosyltransferase family 2 protein [Vibrio vulnificus]HAS8218862.1 glycosyltransferase family 2 protein [Vibrio vulnificus]HAS8299558.1 glycosyltransferase family 2 protein [Vibrio vulnificus]HAS8479213.1 glycosyltransferase family 2 protein [Vibrio vulnificus]
MKKICLIVTTSIDFDVVEKFFSSLKIKSSSYFIDLVFVNQNGNKFHGYDFSGNISLTTIEINHIVPLSKARNIALSYVELKEYDFIAFPDDDCWYEDYLIEKIVDFFENNADCDVLCTNVLDPSNNKTYGGRPVKVVKVVNKFNVFKYPISVGIFVRLENVDLDEIYFNEKLGAGTKIGSGEETELVYRLIGRNNKCMYVGDIFVYHPVVDSNYSMLDIPKYYKYGVGFGYLVREMFDGGNYGIILYYLYIMFRILGGLVLSLCNDINRKVYFYRLKGVVFGFLKVVE